MKIMGIDKEAVKEAAARAFPRKHAQIENGSLFLPGCADGTYRCDHMEELLHVSTCMGFHEVMIQGNQTRVKIEITLVFLKDGSYEVIYEGKKCCHVAMEEDGEIRFLPYEAFLEQIVTTLHPIALS